MISLFARFAYDCTYTDAPSNLFPYRSSTVSLVRLPMDSGMAPVHELVKFCVELHIHRSEANQQTYPIGHSRRARAPGGLSAARAQAGSRLGVKGTCEESSAIGFCFVSNWAYTDSPSNLFPFRKSSSRLVSLPMDSGMVPARGLVSFCVGTDAYTNTHP